MSTGQTVPGVIHDETGDLLRVGYLDWSALVGPGESPCPHAPQPACVRGAADQHHRWDGERWSLVDAEDDKDDKDLQKRISALEKRVGELETTMRAKEDVHD